MRKPSVLLNPDPDGDKFIHKIIPTFQIPWVHRDVWNDKDWYYSVEGKLTVFRNVGTKLLNYDFVLANICRKYP